VVLEQSDLVREAVRMYMDEDVSARQIAATLDVPRKRVSQALRDAGIVLPDRGRGRRRNNRRLQGPGGLLELLRELYVGERMTCKAIGALLGMSESTVRSRLVEHGIALRTKGRCNREDRRDPSPEVVSDLYVKAMMTADRVALAAGTNRVAVLRTAHSFGFPVRPRASAPGSKDGCTLLVEALYTDPQVSAVLRRHGVDKVPPFGPIWARFPEPVPLTRDLVTELYEGCGVALAHIELLTGQPAETVRQHLARWGVALRARGGSCPFLRRLSAEGTAFPRVSNAVEDDGLPRSGCLDVLEH